VRSAWSTPAAAAACLTLLAAGCVPTLDAEPREAVTALPDSYGPRPGEPAAVDSRGAERLAPGAEAGTLPASAPREGPPPAQPSVQQFFTDPRLQALIRMGLEGNQELHIAALEVDIAQYEGLAREGEYLPKIGIDVGAGMEKVGEDTSQGASDEHLNLKRNLPDYLFGLQASWELDIWHELRDAQDAAVKRWLATQEGRRFLVTGFVAEVATSYYELMALDNLLEVLKQNIAIQQDALEVVRLQKVAGKVTELAVKRFEAEVLKNRSKLYEIQQQITETESRLNVLVGRYHQPIVRDSAGFMARPPATIREGVPSALLANRPDVKQAELELEAAKLDVQVARARFYPSLELNAQVAYNSFKAATLVDTPASLAYLVAAELSQPLWNRSELTATYFTANSKQMQAVWDYERTLVKAFNEVTTQLAMIGNLGSSYGLLSQQVARLEESIAISGDLFRSARADYMEVLLTRRDALEAQMELIETKRRQLTAVVKLYRALGGGWE
jgi:multidrug efflux system outer membrane protein